MECVRIHQTGFDESWSPTPLQNDTILVELGLPLQPQRNTPLQVHSRNFQHSIGYMCSVMHTHLCALEARALC